MSNLILGLSGSAQSGKDTFYSILKRLSSKKVTRFALADNLKEETDKWIKNNYRIDYKSCTLKEKEFIRPFWVVHGKLKRNISQGKHWTDLLTPVLQERLNQEDNQILCITDIRYKEYPEDESDWLKKIGGKLIHISMYEKTGTFLKFNKYPNEDEAKNDPILKDLADYRLEWEKQGTNNEEFLFEKLSPIVKECMLALNIEAKE